MAEAAEAARFAADLAALLPETIGPVALAVSGGPDSMALLTLAKAAGAPALIAATVDHGLRTAAATEAAMVAAHCASIGVPHTILRPDAAIAGASLQAQARAARYAVLARWAEAAGAVAIATGHQLDDQAETFLMRAARGSGLSGLAAIRAATTLHGMRVVRPLLGWRRAELRAIVRRGGVPFVDDPANRDLRHDRTRFRALLEANEWLDPPALAQVAGQLAEADADLAAVARWLWAERAVAEPAGVRIDAAGLPRDLRRRLARHAIGTVRELAGIATPAWSNAANVEPLLDALAAGRRATQAGVVASVVQGQWRFRPAPPRRRG